MTIAWYDPTNHHVSTDKNDPMFTPLGQLWPLCEAEKLEKHKRTIAKLQLEIKNINNECAEIYGLLALAHLNIRQHLKYGFSPNTAKSTLISVGQYFPKLKAEMEKNACEQALAQPAQERNFCSRCGKRTPDLTTIHTCTPPHA